MFGKLGFTGWVISSALLFQVQGMASEISEAGFENPELTQTIMFGVSDDGTPSQAVMIRGLVNPEDESFSQDLIQWLRSAEWASPEEQERYPWVQLRPGVFVSVAPMVIGPGANLGVSVFDDMIEVGVQGSVVGVLAGHGAIVPASGTYVRVVPVPFVTRHFYMQWAKVQVGNWNESLDLRTMSFGFQWKTSPGSRHLEYIQIDIHYMPETETSGAEVVPILFLTMGRKW